MKSRSALVLGLFLGGLACTLALPARRGGSTPVPAPARPPSDPAPEEAAFAALLARGTIDPSDATALETRQSLLATLRSIGPRKLARFLEKSVGDAATEDARLVALECLEGCATGHEVGALMHLATPKTGAPSSRLRDALRSAVVKTLERDQRSFAELVSAWRDAGTGLRAELLGALAERGDPAGLELLSWVATFEGPEFHRALAETCLRLAPRARGPEALRHLETLCVLLDSQDGVCVQTISIALARARVEAAIPAWIALLESESRGTRERARRSLEELTGLSLGSAGERWRAWHEAENAWFEQEAPRVFSELASDEDERVLEAAREVARHRLYRDELAQAVEGLLDHASPAVRLCACSVLQGLGSSVALPALTAALADEDEAVARSAWSTLRHLTGLELPFDEALWRKQLAGT